VKKIFVKIAAFMYPKSRSSYVKRFLVECINVMENEMFSLTSRMLLKKYEGVEIGVGSTGPCFYKSNIQPGIKIGNYCSFAPNVGMYTRNHPLQFVSTHALFYNSAMGVVEKDEVSHGVLDIGHDVWIGRNVVILPSCRKIGNGAVVGANAVVTQDIPPYAIVAGVPARIIKYRFTPDTIAKLEEIKWWFWEYDDIVKHKELFKDPASFVTLVKRKE